MLYLLFLLIQCCCFFCQLTQGLEEERSELSKKLTVKGCKCTLEEKLQETKRATQIEDHNEISMQVRLMPFCVYRLVFSEKL